MRTQLGRHYADAQNLNWTLDSGNGPRHSEYYIKFPKAYRRPPDVQVSLYGLDTSNSRNTRLAVTVAQVGREGFVLRFATWANTIVFGAGATWIATPKLGEDGPKISILDAELDLNGIEKVDGVRGGRVV